MRSLLPLPWNILTHLLHKDRHGRSSPQKEKSMNRSQRSLLLVCMTLSLIGISTPKASAQAACYAAWNAATAYNGGQTASYSNVNYTANWWTQGNNPSTNNGGRAPRAPGPPSGAGTRG